MTDIAPVFSIYNANIVTPDLIIENGSLTVENGIITDIADRKVILGENPVDAGSRFLIPGFIDMHSDAIEKEIEARPKTYLATNIAILELDKKLAASGVTTIYHSVSFADEVIIAIRSIDIVESIVREITRLKKNLLVNTRVHARFEITNTGGMATVEKLIGEGLIDLLSVMDHTPGQGQFTNEDQIRDYYGERFGAEKEAIQNLIETRMNLREKIGIQNEIKMMEIARSKGIPVASHDDDTAEKVGFLKKYGAIISEFPVSMEAVKSARDNGLAIALGSPNVLRGHSHNKNLSSRDLIREGFGDIICSDYIPSTLVHAMFTLVDNRLKTIAEAAKMFAENPARFLGIGDITGSIRKGLSADLVVVDNSWEVPRIIKTFVKGREVFSSCI